MSADVTAIGLCTQHILAVVVQLVWLCALLLVVVASVPCVVVTTARRGGGGDTASTTITHTTITTLVQPNKNNDQREDKTARPCVRGAARWCCLSGRTGGCGAWSFLLLVVFLLWWRGALAG